MNVRPLVTIIITTYGENDKLIRAINSCLKQSYQNIEVIIVDDNDPNAVGRRKTESIMRAYQNDRRIKYIQHSRNLNGATARNTGISAANGAYIAFLDDDDFYLNSRIGNAITYLLKNPSIIGICQGVVYIKDSYFDGAKYYQQGAKISKKDILLNQNAIGTGSNLFIQHDVIDLVNGFDTNFKRFQDLEFILRVLDYGTIACCSDVEIVKDCSGVRTPKYRVVKEALDKFIDKFTLEISSLSKNDRNMFYYDRYKWLLWLIMSDSSRENDLEFKKLKDDFTKVGGTNKEIQELYVHYFVSRILAPIKKTDIFSYYKNMKFMKTNKFIDESIINQIKSEIKATT